MRMPRKLTATAISALALALGVTTIQAPSALAYWRIVDPPFPSLFTPSPGDEISFRFDKPKPTAPLTRGTGQKPGNAKIVLRDPQSAGPEQVLLDKSLELLKKNISIFFAVTTPDAPGAELCAINSWPRDKVQAGYDGMGDPKYEWTPAVKNESCVTIAPPRPEVYPRAPYLSSKGDNQEIYPTASTTITALLGGTSPDEQVLSRGVTTSFMNTNNPVSCSIGYEVETVNAVSAGSAMFTYQRTIPGGTVGNYFCMQQFVKTDRMDSIAYSEPVTFRVTSNPNVGADFILLDLSSSLARLLEATQLLDQVQEQPNIDQAELARAAAEAEEARRQAEAAAAQAQARAAAAAAQGQAAPAGTPSAAQIAQAQQEAAAAAAAVEQAIGQATAGTTKQTALSALAIATGFDPFTTPVLNAREKNASGVSIEVTAPEMIRQKKRLRTKLEVLDPVTRGGMRQYLLDLNGPTPKLLLKRTGFVPKGEKNKRFWISKKFQPGTYGLLTTFLPSTPGIQGVAVYDTIEVTKAPKKKKRKRR